MTAQQSARIRRNGHREQGVVLLVSILILALMGIIGLSSLDTVMRDRQAAGHLGLSQAALYAADAGVSESLELLRTEVLAAALTPGDCLGAPVPEATLSNGAAYGPDDTAVDDEICMTATAEDCVELGSSAEIGTTLFRYTVWSVRTQGTAPGGATSRIRATARRCHAFSN